MTREDEPSDPERGRRARPRPRRSQGLPVGLCVALALVAGCDGRGPPREPADSAAIAAPHPDSAVSPGASPPARQSPAEPAGPGPGPGPEVDEVARAIIERTRAEIEAVHFFKPRREGTAPELFALAPLIVIEALPPNDEVPLEVRFGAVLEEPGGTLSVDRERPTVYWERSFRTLSGREHDQLDMFWIYELPDRESSARRLPCQGVRLILDDRGYPAIELVLADSSRRPVMYVSEHLEHAAREAHGAPVRGARFSIESRAGVDEGVVVARTLADGPQPMGPFVYLVRDSRDVSTLLCRCMPTQVRSIAGHVDYSFRPIGELLDLGVEPPSWPDSAKALPRGEEESPPSRDPLERWLRLPGQL